MSAVVNNDAMKIPDRHRHVYSRSPLAERGGRGIIIKYSVILATYYLIASNLGITSAVRYIRVTF